MLCTYMLHPTRKVGWEDKGHVIQNTVWDKNPWLYYNSPAINWNVIRKHTSILKLSNLMGHGLSQQTLHSLITWQSPSGCNSMLKEPQGSHVFTGENMSNSTVFLVTRIRLRLLPTLPSCALPSWHVICIITLNGNWKESTWPLATLYSISHGGVVSQYALLLHGNASVWKKAVPHQINAATAIYFRSVS